MRISKVVIFGGTGFVGQSLCEQLQRLGIQATVPTRHPSKGTRLAHLPNVTVVPSPADDPAALQTLIAGHDAVINLIAILHGTPAAFKQAHVTWPTQLADACTAAHATHPLQHVVHVSALGASPDAPSDYQRSKAAGEAVWQAFTACPTTVLRPSVIFGARDQFLNLFSKLVALTPVLPLAGANTRFQPVWVNDVASAITHSLRAPRGTDETRVIDCTGPDVFTLRELVQLTARWKHTRVWVINVPYAVAMMQAWVMEQLPGPTLMSRDNVRSLQVDNVAQASSLKDDALNMMTRTWGLSPTSLHAAAHLYRA